MPIHKHKDENFFKKWSPEMAYILGFFAADGCMIKNNRGAHYVEFHITDKDILLKIRSSLKSNHKIAERNSHGKKSYRLQIGSKKMFGDLISLGMIPNKSNSLDFLGISDFYFKDFARGYFDGDGNVYISKKNYLLSGFTCGSRKFLEKFHLRLKALVKLSGGSLFARETYYRLYYSTKDSCKLYKYMYNTQSDLFIVRKKLVFEKYLGT